MKVIPLSEGSFTIDKTKVFIPFDKKADDLHHRAIGSLLVEIQPFVIITDKDVILLDTGLGFNNETGQLQIHGNLLQNNIDPSSVTKVLLSHLHKDHAGGIQYIKSGETEPSLSFPNATYYVNKQELTSANENTSASYIPGDFSLLQKMARLVLLEEVGSIDGYIKYEMSGAHCPFHTVFWIEEEGQVIFFGGDVAPQLQQMKNRFVAKYDFDGKKSMELRRMWWEDANANHWMLLFYHDIKTPYVSL